MEHWGLLAPIKKVGASDKEELGGFSMPSIYGVASADKQKINVKT